MGNIRWSALSVSEAMDKAEAEIEEIFEPLWRAYNIAKEAGCIPNLPQYMQQSLTGVCGEIHRITGYDLQRRGSGLLDQIKRVRGDIPEGAIEAEVAAGRWGKTESLL